MLIKINLVLKTLSIRGEGERLMLEKLMLLCIPQMLVSVGTDITIKGKLDCL